MDSARRVVGDLLSGRLRLANARGHSLDMFATDPGSGATPLLPVDRGRAMLCDILGFQRHLGH
eukprot:7811746-Pyramimonas_sp.AAC.1